MRFVALALALCAPVAGHAQFKCIDAAGRVSFQQAPCAGAQRQQALVIRADAPAVSASGAASSVEQRMLKGLEHERRIRDLERAIESTEGAMSGRGAMMSQEIAVLQGRKGRANNNLAGATWEQSLSTEMQAIATKYRTLNEIDAERLKALRVELAALKQAGPR